MTSQLQDNAVVVSAEYHTAADRERAGELLARYMEALAGEIDSRGGIIGHIKTSVEVQYVEMYSLTDKTVMKKTSELPELTLYTAAIVFCVKKRNCAVWSGICSGTWTGSSMKVNGYAIRQDIYF